MRRIRISALIWAVFQVAALAQVEPSAHALPRWRGFNLLNEPANVDPAVHAHVVALLVAAIRAEDPNRLIIDVHHEDFQGRRLDRRMLDLLQQY
jgi:hypothetical protein